MTAVLPRGIRSALPDEANSVDGDETLDEKALVQRIREQLKGQLSGAALPVPAPRPEAPVDTSLDGVTAELRAMDGAHDVADVPVRSHRAVLGPALSAARSVARKLLARSLERQSSYNAANLRLSRAYEREIEALRRRCDALEEAVRQLRAKIGE